MEQLDRFCASLMESGTQGVLVEPEWLAERFVSFFDVSGGPRFDEIKTLLECLGIQSIRGSNLAGRYRGIHYTMDGVSYHIEYEESEGREAQEHTLLHETYEIIHERLAALQPGSSYSGGRRLCRAADRFAAAVLMQPGLFTLFTETSGFNVLELRKAYRRSYATLTLRMAEVMAHQPLRIALYDRATAGPAGEEPTPPVLSSFFPSVIAGTPGFSIQARPGSPLSLEIPRRGKPATQGSAVDRASSTGEPVFLKVRGGGMMSGEDGMALVARPVIWKGEVEKVAFVAVPISHRDKLTHGLRGVPFDHEAMVCSMYENLPGIASSRDSGVVPAQTT